LINNKLLEEKRHRNQSGSNVTKSCNTIRKIRQFSLQRRFSVFRIGKVAIKLSIGGFLANNIDPG